MNISVKMIIACCLMFWANPAVSGEKVAVLDFKSIMASEELGVAVAEILRTELVGIGDYTVIERGMLEQLLSEQQLQLTGAVDSETAVEIGKLVGAKLVVIGSIVKTGSVYTINSRFIDVETGVAKVGQNIRGQGEDQISNMVHQLALIIAGKTVTEEPPQPGAIASAPAQPSAATLLFSFEQEREVGQWQPFATPPKSMKRVKKWATDGEFALHVVFPKQKEYPEIDTTHAPKDWAAFQEFAFDVASEANADFVWHLAVRIDDSTSSPQNQHWFDAGFSLAPGANTIRIPIAQIAAKINIHDIRRVMLFTETLTQEVEIYLDAVRLEGGQPAAAAPEIGHAAPFMFSFEQEDEMRSWRPTEGDRRIQFKRSQERARDGRAALSVTLPKASPMNKYPGMFSLNFPSDWSSFRAFSAAIYLDEPEHETLREKKQDRREKILGKETPVLFCVRIDDINSTSYATRFHLNDVLLRPGWNDVAIPLDDIRRVLDVKHITNVIFFLNEPKERARLFFDAIRLE